MIFWLVFALAWIVGVVRLAWSPTGRRTRQNVLEILVSSLLVVNNGIGGLLGFYGHTARAAETAASIGWPAGNPFQSEVGGANLVFGVLGLLSVRPVAGFRLAAALGKAVFAYVAGAVHIAEVHRSGNLAPYNVGAVLPDFLIPLIVLVFVWLWVREQRRPRG